MRDVAKDEFKIIQVLLIETSFALGVPLILHGASVATHTAGGSVKILSSTLLPRVCAAATIACGSSRTGWGTGRKKRRRTGAGSAGSGSGSRSGGWILFRIDTLRGADFPKGYGHKG